MPDEISNITWLLTAVGQNKGQLLGAFHLTICSGNSRWGSEWNIHFPEFQSEILYVPRKVGLNPENWNIRKIPGTG